MKIINKLTAILLLTLVCFSCDNVIDNVVDIDKQPGELGSDEAFQNIDDLQSGLDFAYLGLNTEYPIQISSLFTDETSIGFDNGGQNINLYQFQVTTNLFIASNMWISNYNTINLVNRVLQASENIEIDDEEQDRFDDILAQLYAIRAAEHFELLTYFSTDLSDDSALGVIKADFVPLISDQLPRSTIGEIFDLIESDLSLVKNLLDDSRSNPLFITNDFVTALESRMALYRGMNDLAMSLAQELIDTYPLANRPEYFNLFRDASNTGIIFKGERNQSNINDETDEPGQIAANFYFRNVGINGGAFMELSRSLYNLLNSDDIRFNTIVEEQSQPDPNYQLNAGKDDILLIGKYPGSNGQPLQNGYKYFRIAEMYLIKAEVQAREDDWDAAAATLKMLRDARFTTPTALDSYSTKNEALTAVLNERRIELAFEGHRYIDIKRFTPDLGISIDRDPIDCETFNACTLGADDFFKFTFPIPQDELAGNTVIREQQNPGYN